MIENTNIIRARGERLQDMGEGMRKAAANGPTRDERLVLGRPKDLAIDNLPHGSDAPDGVDLLGTGA